MPSNDHYVIIGNGPAGNHAADTLRKKDDQAKITIISDECVPFYYKPRLTGFISGEISREEMLVNAVEDYEQKKIRLRLGQCVDQIDPAQKIVRLQHMELVHYTKLIIASGSRARILPSMSGYARHLNFISSYSDAMQIKEKIHQAGRFFIFGGDLVAFRFARMLKTMGKKTTVLIYPHAFWPYNLTDDMLDKIQASLSRIVSKIIVKDDIRKIEKNDGQYTIVTQKKSRYEADLVFSFNGLIPNIDFAFGSGIDIDHGILVDEYLKTNLDDIYACGSCAQVYNPAVKSYSASIGWPNATVQGEVAAMNLLGEDKVSASAGRKYFDLEGVKIKTTWWEDIDDE